MSHTKCQIFFTPADFLLHRANKHLKYYNFHCAKSTIKNEQKKNLKTNKNKSRQTPACEIESNRRADETN